MFAEREPHVFEIAAGAVNESDRRRVARRTQIDDVLTKSADVDEAPARRMRPLDQPRADESDDGAGGEDFGGDSQRVTQSF
jgi:hypothetical protein